MRTSTHNICLDEARKWGDAEYMTDGLILTNSIAHSLLLDGPVRLNFIVMGLCKKGEATYSVDTCQHKVKAGDLMFISDGHILDAYEPSSNYECHYILVSTEFIISWCLPSSTTAS